MDRLYLRPAGRGATWHAPEPATVVVAGCVCRGFGEGLKGGALRGQKLHSSREREGTPGATPRSNAPDKSVRPTQAKSKAPLLAKYARNEAPSCWGGDPRVGVVLRTENARSNGDCR